MHLRTAVHGPTRLQLNAPKFSLDNFIRFLTKACGLDPCEVWLGPDHVRTGPHFLELELEHLRVRPVLLVGVREHVARPSACVRRIEVNIAICVKISHHRERVGFGPRAKLVRDVHSIISLVDEDE